MQAPPLPGGDTSSYSVHGAPQATPSLARPQQQQHEQQWRAKQRQGGEDGQGGGGAWPHDGIRNKLCNTATTTTTTTTSSGGSIKPSRRRPTTAPTRSSRRRRRRPAAAAAFVVARNAFLLLAAAVLTGPSLNTNPAAAARDKIRQLLNGDDSHGTHRGGRRGWALGVGVLAAPCADAEGTGAGGGGAQQVAVSPDNGVDLLSVFDCEGGEFDVSWSGEVLVPGTIYIGRGTTVRIVGETGSTTATSTASSSSSSSNITFVDENDRPQEWVEALSTALPPLPNGLPAAAVATAPSAPASASKTTSTTATTTSATSMNSAANETDGTGSYSASEEQQLDQEEEEEEEPRRPTPIFFVDGGELFLENLAVRGGYTANSTDSMVYTYTDDPGAYDSPLLEAGVASGTNSTSVVVVSGGAVHAVDANVTVTGCEFEDNFAELWGGAIFANGSSLVVRGSVFRRCWAGEQSVAADEGVEGAGGGIGVSDAQGRRSCLVPVCASRVHGHYSGHRPDTSEKYIGFNMPAQFRASRFNRHYTGDWQALFNRH